VPPPQRRVGHHRLARSRRPRRRSRGLGPRRTPASRRRARRCRAHWWRRSTRTDVVGQQQQKCTNDSNQRSLHHNDDLCFSVFTFGGQTTLVYCSQGEEQM
jgi:hypothetical protein